MFYDKSHVIMEVTKHFYKLLIDNELVIENQVLFFVKC
jgi:hypothetical protein